MTDPISDMLTRIRNANAIQKPKVEVPFSKLKLAMSKVLERRGFLKGVEIRKLRGRRVLELELRYIEGGEGAITGLRRISKPGARKYAPAHQLWRIKGGRGIAVISTSQGIVTDREAKNLGLGGEVLCEVW